MLILYFQLFIIQFVAKIIEFFSYEHLVVKVAQPFFIKDFVIFSHY